MTTAREYRAKLAEFDALPDDLAPRIMWVEKNPPPKLTITCRCGRSKPHEVWLNWGEVRQHLARHGTLETELESTACGVCEPETED